MQYKSTRNSSIIVSSAQAIISGISEEGGLFVPESLPKITLDEIKAFAELDYASRAEAVYKKFLTDFTDEEISYCAKSAYNTDNFDTESIAEISHLYNGTYLLELWHGPTCAFKDMALQILPYFMKVSAKKLSIKEKIIILVATSGDTGKAALEGFRDVDGTGILVFYPEDGVSPMQKLQMTSQDGENVKVCAVKGNFDDCQNGVKQIFTDEGIKSFLNDKKLRFSSANSINWGRLLPQIVYYISAYASLAKDGEIEYGEKINVVVPTGNFGNILAAYYAKNMGLPIAKLICASNQNKVLTDFINTGKYDRKREFFATSSPSMDILVSSNLERLLYALCGENDSMIRDWFGKLTSEGYYEVTDEVKKSLQDDFIGGFCDDIATADAIKETFEKYSYVPDTHTAVAIKVYNDYRLRTGDETKTIIASTASPYKFAESVLKAIGEDVDTDEFLQLESLSKISNTDVPEPLADLRNKKVRFSDSVETSEMCGYVRNML